MQVDVREAPDQSREVLEAMLAMAEKAPEPGSIRPQDVIHKGTEDLASPMVVSSLQSAGYTIVYSILPDGTYGQPSLCNNNMLVAQLRKVAEVNGRRLKAFSLNRPADAPTGQTGQTRVRCLFHPSRREKWMDEAGLSVCTKGGLLANEYQAMEHAKHRHKSELAALQMRQAEEERKEQRAASRALLRLMEEREQPRPRVAADPGEVADRMAVARAARAAKRTAAVASEGGGDG